MLSLVAAVLLTAAPASPSPSPRAAEALLSGRYLSARLLVAQAPPDAPSEAAPPAPPSEPPAAPQMDPELEARIQDLTSQVGLLQSEIRSIDVNFPIGSLVMAYFGYVLSPLLLIGIPLIIIGLNADDSDDRSTLVGLGTGLSVTGAVGVGLLVGGLVTGSRESSANRARREELIRERIRLEDDLRDLKTRRDARSTLQARRWRPHPTLPLVGLHF
ncbi:hypothetical protein [Pyxidicoccus trucidator]|uniref:hypothetical protein n=1 Tax=Pyxidicoccus trucidator TaxID=2709662 RepID=UPI0013DB73C3|nr:hypothetical protein [Pyxidicoccus trucidator]